MELRLVLFFFSSRRRHTRYWRDWSSDVCSSDLSWHPSTTFYGFRYCTVTATQDVEIQAIEAWPISSSNDDTGSLSTSNDMVNQLISNIEWGQRGNLLSIPTDCPQRDEDRKSVV